MDLDLVYTVSCSLHHYVKAKDGARLKIGTQESCYLAPFLLTIPVSIPISAPGPRSPSPSLSPSHFVSTMYSSAYPSIHPFRAPAARHHCDRKRKPPPGTTTRILHSIKFSSQGQIAHHSNSIRTASSLIPSRTGALAYLTAVLIVHVTRIVSRARTLAQISLTV